MQLLTPTHWGTSYYLLDSGNFEKLEMFNGYLLARPEPQAIWDKALPTSEWERQAKATFIKAKGADSHQEKGEWKLKPAMPERWWLPYAYKDMHFQLRLALTGFKHVGVFPEQSENWNYIYDTLNNFPSHHRKVLNLFAYTGGASLAARCASAEVTHVEAIKQTTTWARENMEGSDLQDIRWVIEDALTFVKREAKRNKKYNLIILDPPAYGRGPAGEKWVLEDHLNQMLQYCKQILDEQYYCIILNLYSMGLSALVGESLFKTIFKGPSPEIGELYINDLAERKLPLGVFIRMKSL